MPRRIWQPARALEHCRTGRALGMRGHLDDDPVGQIHPKCRARSRDVHRHQRRRRGRRLGHDAAALECRTRGIQRTGRQPMGLGICLQRLTLTTSAAQMVEPELLARAQSRRSRCRLCNRPHPPNSTRRCAVAGPMTLRNDVLHKALTS